MSAIGTVQRATATASTNATAAPHWTAVSVNILPVDGGYNSDRVNFNAAAKTQLAETMRRVVEGYSGNRQLLVQLAHSAMQALPTLKLDGLDKKAAIAEVVRLAPKASENPTRAKEAIAEAVVDFLALNSAASVVLKKAEALGVSGAEVMIAIGRGNGDLAQKATAAMFAAEMLEAKVLPSQSRSAKSAGLDDVLALAQTAVNIVMTRADQAVPQDRAHTHWVPMYGPVVEQVDNTIPKKTWERLLTRAGALFEQLAA